MSTDISVLRARLRIDLSEATADRWADEDLDRHIHHGIRDLNRVAPREMVDSSLTIADPASRALDIAPLTGLISVAAVEYPVGGHPRRLRHFELWGSTLTLLTDTMPLAGAPVNVFYTVPHTADASGSTIPDHMEDIVLVGAAGYALLDHLASTHDRVTIGGRCTADHLHRHASDLLMQFRQDLTALKRQRRHVIRTGELWTEDER